MSLGSPLKTLPVHTKIRAPLNCVNILTGTLSATHCVNEFYKLGDEEPPAGIQHLKFTHIYLNILGISGSKKFQHID